MQILSGRRNRVLDLVFSRCGRWLAAGGFGGVHVWDTANPTAKPRCPEPKKITGGFGLAFRADGRLFFRALNGRWSLYDPATNALTTLRLQNSGDTVPAPDGRFVAEVRGPAVRVWSFPDGADEPESHRAFKSPGPGVTGVAFAPDDTTFATADVSYGTTDGTYFELSVALTVRAVPMGKAIATLGGAAGSTSAVRYSGDGAHLLAFWAASAACWTIAEPEKAPCKAVNPSRKHFVSMAVHPSGPLLTVDNDRLVRVWDVPALTTDRTIAWNVGKLYAVAVSPDGTRAAVGSNTGKVLVWDWD